MKKAAMKRRINLVAGLHLTATEKAYINAILDAGQERGHRTGGLSVTLRPADRQAEIDRYSRSTFHSGYAQSIERHTVKGRLYVVETRDRDGRTTRQIVDIAESNK